MSAYKELLQKLQSGQERWLVTGAAGFVGSNLVEALLRLGQKVVGLDNLSTGYEKNLELAVREAGKASGKDAGQNFTFINGDIRDLEACRKACAGAKYVLHQAALGSVPRSLQDPITTNQSNIDGFLNMLVAARDAGISGFVYAASSSTYGDEPNLPKIEERIGNPLSPYAVTKYVNELYARVFASCYGFRGIGLRYFNIFGKRQDPNGAYAAVIPQWFNALLAGQPVYINGDGETSRDFCHIENCVQANLLAATAKREDAWNEVYNVACADRTTLNELFEIIKAEVAKHRSGAREAKASYRDFRAGDVRHSLADISKARERLGYAPEVDVRAGLGLAGGWYAS